MQKLVKAVTWINKRLSLLIVMVLAGWIMAFQTMWLRRFKLEDRLKSGIAEYGAAQSNPAFGLDRGRIMRG
jgi:hypothetical protein